MPARITTRTQPPPQARRDVGNEDAAGLEHPACLAQERRDRRGLEVHQQMKAERGIERAGIERQAGRVAADEAALDLAPRDLEALDAGVAAVRREAAQPARAAADVENARRGWWQQPPQDGALLRVDELSVGMAEPLDVIGEREAIVVLDDCWVDHARPDCNLSRPNPSTRNAEIAAPGRQCVTSRYRRAIACRLPVVARIEPSDLAFGEPKAASAMKATRQPPD